MSKTNKTIIYKKPRIRWATNIGSIEHAFNSDVETEFVSYVKLCENPQQSITSVSTQFTIKNPELQFQIECNDPEKYDRLTCYVMYVPQGITPTADLINYHPEYIMALRYFGGPDDHSNINRNPLIIKSRLSRKLNTGDGIYLLISGKHFGTANDEIVVRGVIRWWSKTN